MSRSFVNPIYKDVVTTLETSAETNGKHSLSEVMLLPGGKNIPHTHSDFAETFTAITGRLGVHIDGENIYLHPGQSITIERQQVHYFFNPGKDSITFTVKFTPGHDGMEKGLRILYGLATDGMTNSEGVPTNLVHASIVMNLMNSYPTGVLGKMKPILILLAKLGQMSGTREKLIKKYIG